MRFDAGRIAVFGLGLGLGLGLGMIAASVHAAAAKELTIGYITTLSGGVAMLGKAQVNGLMLGLEKHGWKKDGDVLAGVAVKLVIADDEAKPDVALQLARKMIQSDKAQIIAGMLWSHVLIAIQEYVTESGRVLMSTNAGPSTVAGSQCSRLFVSTSFQNDEAAEAMGLLMNRDRIDNVFLMAPNYQAGKDYLAGFRRTFQGKIAGQTLFKVGQADFQADISGLRAAKPGALFIFAPGGMGISFMKQWDASGVGQTVKLYTVHTVDYLSLGPIGKSAVGGYHVNQWKPDSPNPRNQEFVKSYVAKYGAMPSMFSVPSYDAVALIVDGLKAVKGNVEDGPKFAAAMRKGGLRSVRGDLDFNVNGFLVQPWFRREVVLADSGLPMIKGGEQVMFQKDRYWQECPATQQVK